LPMFNVGRYLDDYVSVLRQLDERAVERTAHVLLGAWRMNRAVFCCGNGGSAATACHIAADLAKLTQPPGGRRLRAVSLTESMSAISAIANDIAYQEIFAEQLRTLLAPGDVLLALSTSGSSPNVIRAVEYVNTAGGITVGVTGLGGIALHLVSQHCLVVQSTSVQQVEDATMVVGHLLCLRTKELIARDGQEALSDLSLPLPGLRVADAAR
jgi:D-sedoheptulose 7-phosphate isomerase